MLLGCLPSLLPQMALLSSVYLFFLGMASVAWAVSSKADDAELKGWGSTVVGFYSMALAVAIVLFEFKFGMRVPLLQVRRHAHVAGLHRTPLSHINCLAGGCVVRTTGHTRTCARNLPNRRVSVRLFLWPHHPGRRMPCASSPRPDRGR